MYRRGGFVIRKCTEQDVVEAGAFALNADPQGKYGKASWKKDIPIVTLFELNW